MFTFVISVVRDYELKSFFLFFTNRATNYQVNYVLPSFVVDVFECSNWKCTFVSHIIVFLGSPFVISNNSRPDTIETLLKCVIDWRWKAREKKNDSFRKKSTFIRAFCRFDVTGLDKWFSERLQFIKIHNFERPLSGGKGHGTLSQKLFNEPIWGQNIMHCAYESGQAGVFGTIIAAVYSYYLRASYEPYKMKCIRSTQSERVCYWALVSLFFFF